MSAPRASERRQQRKLSCPEQRCLQQEQSQRESQEAIKKLKVTIHEKEVETKAKQQLIYKHEGQLNAAGSKKEYDALKTEIAAEKKARAEHLAQQRYHVMVCTKCKTESAQPDFPWVGPGSRDR